MGVHVLSNPKLWVAGYDFSGAHRAMALRYGADAVDVSAFGDGTRVKLGGLKQFTFAHEGHFDASAGADSIDAFLHGNIAVDDVLGSFSAEAGAEGDVAYFAQLLHAEYSPGGSHGEAHTFSVAGESSGQYGLLRGIVAANKTAVAASANGTGFNRGAVSAAQRLY